MTPPPRTTPKKNDQDPPATTTSTKKPTIAYVISITACGSDTSLIDGATVLSHSITLSRSSYPHKLYAIVHPDARDCASPLRHVGFTVLIRDVPVPVAEISSDFLREKVVTNGCCGEKEYIKLWVYSLVEHEIAVHLDTDTIILKKMDGLFDAMFLGPEGSPEARSLPVAFGKALPKRIDAFFTRDYNMVKNRKHVGVQGGFLVLKPSMQVFDDYSDIIRNGKFEGGRGGWGDAGFGGFYGSMTFQGIVPYYYDIDPKNRGISAVELNRCYYNNMADNPRTERTVNDVVHGKCRDGRHECEDCRDTPLNEIVTAHFTLCQKPWICMSHSIDLVQHRLCRKLHHEWFKVRANLEDKVWRIQRTGKNYGQTDPMHFMGYCKGGGERNYLPMRLPGAAIN
eukprot:CAMPEP_0172510092 /NCGR_PEP_ID=MMETSP1066-20121228/226140_1 /TAXON_ID=671091 /ORGANISM="Coscinodiscus wailesii, Strain CCMP2513" /LENGTH=396 /DNA_ID=CAMNT_0013288921 /DNA_START=402 /DNA_END=1592 /DNA_ORIENTATION=+